MATCPAGYICDDTGSSLQYACEELKVYVEEKGFGPILDGIYCPEGKSKIQNCPAGYFCENATDDAQECPEEYFCPMKVGPNYVGELMILLPITVLTSMAHRQQSLSSNAGTAKLVQPDLQCIRLPLLHCW